MLDLSILLLGEGQVHDSVMAEELIENLPQAWQRHC